MLASLLLQSEPDPPKGGQVPLEKLGEGGESSDPLVNLRSSVEVSKTASEEYVQLQLRIYRMTLIVGAFAVAITAIIFDLRTSISLLVGALSGLLYLRLLARSVWKLGKSSKSVSKIQLVIPVLLVLMASKFPQLELLPSLLGFLLYKPSLILQVTLESSTRDSL